MPNRPKPTFNLQCPVSRIAVLEEKDLIATFNYASDLEIRSISNQKILYQKPAFYVDKMHFLSDNLLMYDEYSFTLLDWKNDIVIKKSNGFVFSNLKYYLTYQEGAFQLKSFSDDVVLWENSQDEVDSFSAKMANDFLFIKTTKNESSEFQLWDFKQNNKIDFKDYIKKEINFTIDNSLLDSAQFICEGRELLIEQFQFNSWRIIVFSLDSLKVIENLILEQESSLPRPEHNRIFCFKNHIYYLHDENQLMKYDKSTKRLNCLNLAFNKSEQIDSLLFNENLSFVYLFGENEILSLQLETGMQFLTKHELHHLFEESALFLGFIMYTSCFSDDLVRVDLKTNGRKQICYASDEVDCSQVLKDKILNFSDYKSVTIWDLKTNKVLKRKNFSFGNYRSIIFKELMESYNIFRFELGSSLNNSIKQLDYDENLNLLSSKDLPHFNVTQEFSLDADSKSLIFQNNYKTITYCDSTNHWTKEAHDFFNAKSYTNVSQKTHNGYGYIAKDALYKIDLGNGDMQRGVIFREYDSATSMLIANDFLFMGMEGFCIFIIDLQNFQVLHKISTDHEFSHSLIFCPKRNFLFVASSYCSEITIFDVLTGKLVQSWQAHERGLAKLFYLENQNALLSVSRNGSMRKWDYNSFELLDEYYSLPAMPDKNYKKGWAHIDRHGRLSGSIHCKNYFNTITK